MNVLQTLRFSSLKFSPAEPSFNLSVPSISEKKKDSLELQRPLSSVVAVSVDVLSHFSHVHLPSPAAVAVGTAVDGSVPEVSEAVVATEGVVEEVHNQSSDFSPSENVTASEAPSSKEDWSVVRRSGKHSPQKLQQSLQNLSSGPELKVGGQI